MKFFPATKHDRYSLLLFPFNAYVVLAPFLAITFDLVFGPHGRVPYSVAQEVAQRYALLLYGYIGCIAALLLGAATLRDRAIRRSAIIFAAIGLIGTLLLLPATSVPRTRSATAPNQPADRMAAGG